MKMEQPQQPITIDHDTGEQIDATPDFERSADNNAHESLFKQIEGGESPSFESITNEETMRQTLEEDDELLQSAFEVVRSLYPNMDNPSTQDVAQVLLFMNIAPNTPPAGNDNFAQQMAKEQAEARKKRIEEFNNASLLKKLLILLLDRNFAKPGLFEMGEALKSAQQSNPEANESQILEIVLNEFADTQEEQNPEEPVGANDNSFDPNDKDTGVVAHP